MRNLVLGIIDNYKFGQIKIFLLSLKEVAGNEHVCLFVGPKITSSVVKKIEGLGAETIRYKNDFPFISTPHAENFKTLPHRIHIYNFRHFLYYDYLLKNSQKFKNVLLTDVKDVFFQKNPFGFNIENKLYVAVENTAISIENCECTSKWIRRGYGEVMLETMKTNEVICAGTILAPEPQIRSYLHRLIQEFFAVKNVYNCADQAMHNVLVHSDKLGPTQKCYNFNGPILTVGTEQTYILNKQGELVNKDGGIVSIVHQYDRHQELVQLLHAKFTNKAGIGKYFKELRKLFFRSSRVA